MLYIIGTPIGNLGDFSPRAQDVLKKCDFAACEDTRVTLKLLNHFNIKLKLLSYHQHNRAESEPGIFARLLSGQSGALVTDAGMPAISDPGCELIEGCIEHGIEVCVVPGPDAIASAVALSGLDCGRFCFEGFLSTAKKHRREHLDELKTERRTMVFYEAPHKLLKTLRDMYTFWGDRNISISREMTKLFEETKHGKLSEMLKFYAETPPKGEFVLVIEGAGPPQPPTLEDAILIAKEELNKGKPKTDAARFAALKTGLQKREIYKELNCEEIL